MPYKPRAYIQDWGSYLRSLHWRRFRMKVIRRAGFECDICSKDGGSSLDVHHWTYERVPKEELSDCSALCGQCHSDVHRFFGGEVLEPILRRSGYWLVRFPIGDRWIAFEHCTEMDLPKEYFLERMRNLMGAVR